MIDFERRPSYDVKDLERIVAILRGPGGCPWDAEQTHKSIRRNFLEEAYEAAEAIDEESPEHLKEELGDVLLQVALHAQMERELGRFDLDGVADGICQKLIYRHPHVFGEAQVSGTGQVLENWEQLKRTEKGLASHTDALVSVARSLPALWRAEKVQAKARKAGFDWDELSGPLSKLDEELDELKAALHGSGNVAEELGDLLFAAVNLSRFLSLDCEELLNTATDKFIGRFSRVEELARARGEAMEKLPLSELDKLWAEAKCSGAKESARGDCCE